MPSCVSFKRALAVALVSAGLAASSGFAQVGADASPSPSPAPEEFLQLPSHDLERVMAAKPEKAGDPGIRAGDRLEFKLSGFRAPEGAQVMEHPEPRPSASPLALMDQGVQLAEPPARVENGELIVTLMPIKSGALTVPSMLVVDAAGKAIARTNPLELRVASVIPSGDPKPDKPADTRPPIGLGFPWHLVAAASLLLILLGAVGYHFYRKWNAGKGAALPPLPAAPPAPEDVVALESLDELEKRGYPARGQFKPHYFRLSEILKAYLGRRYGFDALESTTQELIRMLEERRITTDTKIDRVEDLYFKLDRVKFTDHVPDAAEPSALMAEARELVRATRRPRPVTPPPSGSGGGS